jgi:hypothetical protein
MTAAAPGRRCRTWMLQTLIAVASTTLFSLAGPAAATPRPATEAAAARAEGGPAAAPRARVVRLRTVTVSGTAIGVRWKLRRRARVARYRIYLDGKRVATLRKGRRRYAFRGLACGTRYRLAVEGRRAGKRVGRRARVTAATARCGAGGPGAPWSPPPTPPSVPDKPARVFVSPSGSDAAACTAAAPCRSFARAYRVAQPGEQVELAGGSYTGQQEVPVDASKEGASEDVIFRPAPGASVRLESLDVYGKHVEVRAITIERDFYVKCHADDVTLRASKAALFFIRSADNVSIVDTEFGPSTDISQIGIIGGEPACEPAPRNIVMDGVFMHDYANSATHMECITLQAFEGMVIRRSRFVRCQDFDVFVKARAPALHNRDLLIENSWFDDPSPTGSSAIQFSEPDGGGSYANVLIRNNSFDGTLTLKPTVTFVNAGVISNVGTRWGGDCSQVGSSHNVWSGGDGCSPTDLRAPTAYRDPENFDFHLRPGAPAIDHGHRTNHPATDIDGHHRPDGSAPDAGADETA